MPAASSIGAASITSPDTDRGRTHDGGGSGQRCQTCHETAPYVGMLASSATAAGDSRPTAFDKSAPDQRRLQRLPYDDADLPTNQTGGAKPANHIPTNAPCAQCHTTAGNYALYSVTGTHQGVTSCLTCHGRGRPDVCQHQDRRRRRPTTSRSAASTATARAATPPAT